MTTNALPFGHWPSPITADDLSGDLRLSGVTWADDETVVWREGRSGKGVLVAGSRARGPRDLTRAHDVQAQVGYGGADFTVHNGDVYFSERGVGRLWRMPLDVGAPRPVTPAGGHIADPQVAHGWVLYVHSDSEGIDRIAVVDAEGKRWPQILAEGHDFYMQPRFSPDGRQVAFIAWDHPRMPWDGTTLYHGRFEDGRLREVTAVAGGPKTAVFQPELLADGTLLYVSDETGWGQLWRHDLTTGQRTRLSEDGVEYGRPAWVQGLRSYCRLAGDRAVVCIRNERGIERLERIDLDSGQRTLLQCDSTSFDHIAAAPEGERIAWVGAADRTPPRVWVMDLASGEVEVRAHASMERVAPSRLATCEPIAWPTASGEEAYGMFYRPAGGVGPDGERPPLIVFVHGGPTTQVRASWDARTQYFATRGYAVLWVNYRGSTGFGRAYQTRLRESWGVLDVEDCASAVAFLAGRGDIDGDRCVIAGGSAGGYTVWQSLIHAPDVFAAGIAYYGVADLFSLARDTHKFESRYLDSLVGTLPEHTARYRERSPVYHADKITKPVAVYQGSGDRVVPQNQSDAIVKSLVKNRVSHVYHIYEGEGHGFRKAETLQHWFASMEEFLKTYVLIHGA
ncbi:MAG: S9 family peptidase [Myxococcota bacterium]